MYAHLIDLGRTFDIESLSMSLITNSFFKKNKDPLDTLTGIRIRRARMAIGTNIFSLLRQNGNDFNCHMNFHNKQEQLLINICKPLTG